MKEARDSVRRTTFAVAALSVCMTAGCQMMGSEGMAAAFAPNAKTPAMEKPVADNSTESVTHIAAAEAERVDQARDEVLAFIHRLDQIEQEQAPPVETTLPPPIERPITDGGVQTGGVAEPVRPSVADQAPQPAPRSPDPPAAPSAETARVPRIVSVSIRADQDWSLPPTRASRPDEAPADPTSVANVPIGVVATSSEDAKIDAMIERLAERSAHAPNDLQAQWRLALLRLADGEDAPDAARALGMLEGPAALLGSAVRAMDATRTAMEDPTGAIDDALTAVDALRQELRARAELSVPTFALCSRVQAFGMFDELPADAFRPGVQNQAIVYFAVDNFSSEQSPDGRMRTLLNSRLEVLTADGKLEWEFEESRVEDFCVRRREDFFVAQRILLPARLLDGAYVLKVTVEDVLANKRTQALHPFNIGTVKSKFQD